MQDQQQQQQQRQQERSQFIHPGVLVPVDQSRWRHVRRMIVGGHFDEVNHASVHHLAKHLQGNDGGQNVTELELNSVRLSSPADGGLEVLCDLFASTTTITKLELWQCDFSGTVGGTQALESLRSNSSITDLKIGAGFCEMEGAAFGTCLSRLLHNNPTLVRLDLFFCRRLSVEGIRALLPGIGNLKVLRFSCCGIDDEGLGLIATSLVGNAAMQILDISDNKGTTPNSIVHFTTLLQSTRLREINLEGNDSLLNAQNLQRLHDDLLLNTHLLKLVMGDDVERRFPQQVAAIRILLARNEATSLLTTVQPQTGFIIPSNSGIWPAAIAKWASSIRADDGSFLGTSAIFTLFQRRPILVDLTLPQRSSRKQQQQQEPPQPAQGGNGDNFAAMEQQEAEGPQPLQVAVPVVQEPERDGDPDGGENRGDDSVAVEELDHHHGGVDEQPNVAGNVGDGIMAALDKCQQLQPRINRLGHNSTWQNDIQADLYLYLYSEGLNRAAFTRAVNRLSDYEQRMAGNSALDQQQQNHHQQNPQPQAAPAAAGRREANENDDMNDSDHDDSSSNNNPKRRRVS